MSKALKNSNLSQRSATRALLAVSLSVSMAAFGCTTDRTLGNGDPVTTPGMRTSPTGGTSSGSETTPTPPPMTSASGYTTAQALPTVTPRMKRLSAAEAAAVVAQQQPRVRYLGVAYPGNGGAGYASDQVVTGQFQNPALRTNPQVTINSSISSQPTTAISSGQGEGAIGGTGGFSGAAFIGGATIASSTGAGTATGTPFTANNVAVGSSTTGAGTTGTGLAIGGNATNAGVGTTGTGGAVFSPTVAPSSFNNGLPLNAPGSFASPTVAPTAYTALNPPTSISANPALAANSTVTQAALGNTTQAPILAEGRNTAANNTSTNNATTSNATTSDATTTNATTGRVRAGGATSNTGSVRIVRDANGRPVITNSNATIR